MNNITNKYYNKYYKFTTLFYHIYKDRKKEKLKLKPYIQIYGGKLALKLEQSNYFVNKRETQRIKK